MDILADLNKKQIEAVTTTTGPVLVLAGAGSGKTRTLIHRLAYLLTAKNILAPSVLAVTFTNKAAKEMHERVGALLGRPSTSFPLVGTFHSVSCRFLRREAKLIDYPSHFSIYDEDDQLSLIKNIIKDLGLNVKQIQPRAVLGAISRAKSDLITPTQYETDKAVDYFTKLVAQVYSRYQPALRANRAFDFDDLINQMVWLWQAHPEVLKRYQNQFNYLLVDEYQDVNRAQYVWTKLLAGESRNLCVVGDDWQSIYSWRGADFGNILRFADDYPEARVIKLEQNYRSTKIIISASNAIMERAELKADKTLWTENPKGESISILEVEDEVAEANFVVSEVIKLAQGKSNEAELIYEPIEETGLLPQITPIARYYGVDDDLHQFAVLYRTNAQSRALEEACLKAGLPYQLIGGVRFYERREIKDILAYLRLLINPFDSISFRRVCLNLTHGLGLTSVELVLQEAQTRQVNFLEEALLKNVNISSARREIFKKLAFLYKELDKLLPKLSVTKLIDEVLKKSGLEEDLLDGTTEGEIRLSNIQELKTVAEERAPGKGREALEQFLTEVSLWQDQDSLNKRKNGITLMTLHSAKGTEFKTVFLVGMEEGLTPHASSLDDPRELEEERRLCYVGLTRAKEKVYCLYASSRRLFGTVYPGIPSRFLGELPEALVQTTIINPF
jgi:DNA helicase-2/ATP-dependent DNA helicase PcrA